MRDPITFTVQLNIEEILFINHQLALMEQQWATFKELLLQSGTFDTAYRATMVNEQRCKILIQKLKEATGLYDNND